MDISINNGDVVAGMPQGEMATGHMPLIETPIRLIPQNAQSLTDCEINNLNNSSDVFHCNQCPSRVYKSNAALNVHRRTVHGVREFPSRNVPCQEPSCSIKTHSVSELRSHLVKDHGLHLKKIDSEFPNMKAFTRWKSQVETSECVCFIAKKSKNLPLERQHYYYCQRSWACRNRDSNLRNAQPLFIGSGLSEGHEDLPSPKRRYTVAKGSDALPESDRPANGIHQLFLEANDKGYVHCTAQLTVREDLRTGRVLVTGCLTHYAHSMTSRHFIEAIHRRSRAGRLREGGVAGQEPVDISSVESRLLAIYELAAAKKKQKSVDKIQAALQDLFDCLKDYDEDDETLPGLEETRAWRQSAAQEEAERERTSRCQNGTTRDTKTPVLNIAGSGQTANGLETVSSQHPTDPRSQETSPSLSVAQIASSDGTSLQQLPLGKVPETNSVVAGSRGERESSTETNGGHLWAFQGEGVVVTTIAHG